MARGNGPHAEPVIAEMLGNISLDRLQAGGAQPTALGNKGVRRATRPARAGGGNSCLPAECFLSCACGETVQGGKVTVTNAEAFASSAGTMIVAVACAAMHPPRPATWRLSA